MTWKFESVPSVMSFAFNLQRKMWIMKPNLSSNNMVQLENIEYVFITKAVRCVEFPAMMRF